MAKNNADYWKDRFTALENRQNKQGKEYYDSVQNIYQRATIEMEKDISKWYTRLADNNKISLAEAKQLLSKNELKEFKWSVAEYIKAGKENAINQRWMKELENASARVHISRLEALKMQMQQHVEVLASEQAGGMGEFLTGTYAEGYYRTGFEIAKGTGVGTNLHKLDTRQVDLAISKPWAQDGSNFSDRIWGNRTKLVNSIHTELIQGIIRGSDPRKVINSLANTMDVSKRQAATLVMTESAAIASRATQDCFNDLGVEKYEILVTLDDKTSNICQDIDGQIFDMKDYAVGSTAPPFHPNCRTTTIPYFNDEFTENEERAARDPETGKTTNVPADMKYTDWKKEFVDTNDKVVKDDSPIIENNKMQSKQVASNVMWNREIIGLSVENANTLNDVHTGLNEHMIKNNTEKIVATSISGNNILWSQTGEVNKVFIDRNQLKSLNKGTDNDIILTHNHPSNNGFSQADIEKLANNRSVRALTIECIDGTKYYLDRGNFKSGFFGSLKFSSVFDQVDAQTKMKFPEFLENDQEKIAKIWTQYVDERNSLLAEKLGMIYKKVGD